jgi:hypothetical protein
MSETLDIVVFATGDYLEIFEKIFRRTLPPDIDHVYAITADGPALPGQTDDDSYKERMRLRLEVYLQHIRRNRGKKMLFLDCDIVFFKSFKNDFLTFLDSNDMFIQKDYIGGIIGVKCNQAVEEFFEHMIERCKAVPPAERKDGYPQCQLEATIEEFINNRGFQLIELPEKYGFLTDDTVMYHAINAGRCIGHKSQILYFVYHWVNFRAADFTAEELQRRSEGNIIRSREKRLQFQKEHTFPHLSLFSKPAQNYSLKTSDGKGFINLSRFRFTMRRRGSPQACTFLRAPCA